MHIFFIFYINLYTNICFALHSKALGPVSCTGIYNKPRVHGVGLATVAASLNDS